LDTLTHALIGIGIAALAQASPEIAANPQTGQAIFWVTQLASQAPDLDILVRIKNYTTYLRHHRGFSHSLPAQLVGSILSAVAVKLFYPTESFLLLWSMALVAILLHVGLDLLTSYGTQAFAPFRQDKYAYDLLTIVDPFLLVMFTIGTIHWFGQIANPPWIFGIIFTFTGLYLLIKWQVAKRVKFTTTKNFNTEQVIACSIIPTFSPNRWQYVIETKNSFHVGTTTIISGKVIAQREFPKPKPHKVIAKAHQSKRLSAFCEIARHRFYNWQEVQDGYLVICTDLRYRLGSLTPFSVYVLLDQDLQVIKSGMGRFPKKISFKVAG
jgi:inner membrane protein